MAEPFSKNEVYVLSFDGGGSRGIMEAIMLDHIMKIATLMRDQPEDILTLISEDGKLEKFETRENLKQMINHMLEPVHPTEVFQFIVGKK